MFRHLKSDCWPRSDRPPNLHEFWLTTVPVESSDYEKHEQGKNQDNDEARRLANHGDASKWKERQVLRRKLIDEKWKSITSQEMEALKLAYDGVKQKALEDNIAAEVLRSGQSRSDVFPTRDLAHFDLQADAPLNQLPDDILAKIFSELELFDVTVCGCVCQRWHKICNNHIRSLKSFRYSLSLHVLRHRDWMHDKGDFNASRMLLNWNYIGSRMLERILGSCIDLQTLIIDFPVESKLVQQLVGHCPKLQNVIIETIGHNVPADYVADCANLKLLGLSFDSTHRSHTDMIFPHLFISSQGLQNVAARCSSLTGLSLTALVDYSPVGDLSSDDILAILDGCPQLLHLELLGIQGVKVDDLIVTQTLALQYFSLWRSGLDATMDSNQGLLAFLDYCPDLKVLVYEDILGGFSSIPLMASLTSRLTKMPLKRLFLSFNEFYEEALKMLCNGVHENVEIELFDSNLSAGEVGKAVESMALPTDSHVVWRYEIPTIGHPVCCNLLMNLYIAVPKPFPFSLACSLSLASPASIPQVTAGGHRLLSVLSCNQQPPRAGSDMHASMGSFFSLLVSSVTFNRLSQIN